VKFSSFGNILLNLNRQRSLLKFPFRSNPEKQEQPASKEIAEKILAQEDRLGALMDIMYKLPNELVLWLAGWLKSETSTRSYVEIDIADSVNAPLIYTGDLVIKKHTNPKPGDMVQYNFRFQDSGEYGSRLCKVLSVDFKKSFMSVQDLLVPEETWGAGTYNVLYIIDRVIPYGTKEWEELVDLLRIDYNNSEIKSWLNKSIDFIEKNDFYQKEKTTKLLMERLEYVNQNGKYHS